MRDAPPTGRSDLPTDDRPDATARPPVRTPRPRPGAPERSFPRAAATAALVGGWLGIAAGAVGFAAFGCSGVGVEPAPEDLAPPPAEVPVRTASADDDGASEAPSVAADRAAARSELRRAAFERAMQASPPPPATKPTRRAGARRPPPTTPPGGRIHVPLSEVTWVRSGSGPATPAPSPPTPPPAAPVPLPRLSAPTPGAPSTGAPPFGRVQLRALGPASLADGVPGAVRSQLSVAGGDRGLLALARVGLHRRVAVAARADLDLASRFPSPAAGVVLAPVLGRRAAVAVGLEAALIAPGAPAADASMRALAGVGPLELGASAALRWSGAGWAPAFAATADWPIGRWAPVAEVAGTPDGIGAALGLAVDPDPRWQLAAWGTWQAPVRPGFRLGVTWSR